jgi:hypothetical protein
MASVAIWGMALGKGDGCRAGGGVGFCSQGPDSRTGCRAGDSREVLRDRVVGAETVDRSLPNTRDARSSAPSHRMSNYQSPSRTSAKTAERPRQFAKRDFIQAAVEAALSGESKAIAVPATEEQEI